MLDSAVKPDAILPTQLVFSADRLAADCLEIGRRFPINPTYLQMSLTHSERATTPEARAYDGLGSLYDFQKRAYLKDPADFTVFNEDFKDLYFYDVYRKVIEASRLRIGRVRLMLRRPSSCYSMHADESPRYHLAVTSNPDCYFYFKDLGTFRIPTDGRLYSFDATKLHTGFNAGKTDRVHLVFDTIDWRFAETGARREIRFA